MKKNLLSIICVLAAAAVSCAGGNRTNTSASDDESFVVKLDREEFLEKIVNYEEQSQWDFLGERPAVIDFYATWCGPCEKIAPIMDKLSSEYAGRVDFYKIDVDEQQEIAAIFGIQSIPTLYFIPTEGSPKFILGAKSKREYEDVILDFLLPETNQ